MPLLEGPNCIQGMVCTHQAQGIDPSFPFIWLLLRQYLCWSAFYWDMGASPMKGHWDGQVWSTVHVQRDWRNWICSTWKRDTFFKYFTAFYTEVIRGYRQEGEGCLLEVHGSSWRLKEPKSKHGKFQYCEKSFWLWKLIAEHLNRCPARLRFVFVDVQKSAGWSLCNLI